MILQPGVSRGGIHPAAAGKGKAKPVGADGHIFISSPLLPPPPPHQPILHHPRSSRRHLPRTDSACCSSWKTGRKRHLSVGCDLARVCIISTLSLIIPWQIAAVALQTALLLWGSPAEGRGDPPAHPSTFQLLWGTAGTAGLEPALPAAVGSYPPHPSCWVKKKSLPQPGEQL